MPRVVDPAPKPATAAALAFLILLWAIPTGAQGEEPPFGSWEAAPPRASEGAWSTHASVGFMLDPEALLLATGLEYAATENLSVGPLLQFGVDDDFFLFAPTANFRYRFDLSGAESPVVQRLEPFLQAGAGVAYIDDERGFRDEDEVGFLLNGGFGLEYWITDRFSVGNSVLFNGMPDEVANQNFFFSWQFLTARLRF